jgi:hypothetical protein
MPADTLETKWNPAGTGILFAALFKDQETESFCGNDEKDPALHSLYSQDWKKYTYHQDGIIVHRFTNAGANKIMGAELTKAPDFMTKTFGLEAWPGMKPNSQKGVHVKRVRYVNSRGIYYHKFQRIKIATQTLFQVNCDQASLLLELLGQAEAYAPFIGLCMNEAELFEQSSKPTITIAPWVGFPFHANPSTAFNLGTIASHKITAEVSNRSLNEMIVNEYVGEGNGLWSVPKNIDGSLMTADSISSILAVKYVWVGQRERTIINDNYRETFFKQIAVAGEKLIEPSTKTRIVDFELEMTGEVCCALLTVQSQEDIENGNHTKLCDDNGQDYIKSAMLITGDKPIEDGLPAEYLRGPAIIESFGVAPLRHIYLLACFEKNPNAPQWTGSRCVTQMAKIKAALEVKPNSKALVATVHYMNYNAFYTNKHAGFL